MIQKRIYNYFERNPQLRVLFIFDTKTYIESELDEIKEWAEGYVYKKFDGAWFNTKYAIENEWRDKRVILFFPKAICPSTEDAKLKFPLLDVLKANMEYKEDDFDTYMQQYNLPSKFRSFIKRNIGEIMTARVSNILKDRVDSSSFSEDLVCRAFVVNYMGESKLLDWELIIAKLILLDGTGEEKKRHEFWYKLSKNLDANKAVNSKLEKLFGFSYNPNVEEHMKEVAESLKYNCITQHLEAIPGDPYRKYKMSNSGVLAVLNRIYEEGYRFNGKFTEAMTKLSSGIKESEIINIYGTDANYECLSEALGWPILQEIAEHRLIAVPDEVNDRMRSLAERLPKESPIQSAILFVQQVALYYMEVRSLGTLKLNSAKSYVDKYMDEFYLVDLYYRLAIEAFHVLITQDIPNEQILHMIKQQLDQDYAMIANVLNLEWLTCVAEKGAWLSETGLQRQEDFFANEYDASVKQVIIISDALRFEVAKELMQELAKAKHIATLGAYQAMLPTETKYDKPSLLPHHDLVLKGTDLYVDGSTLTTTEQRTTQLNNYREGSICVRYEDVMNLDTNSKRELFKRPLVYIFHDTIDEASHSQNPFEVISACRKAIQQLAVLVKRLHASWNVANVVLTADHGFIYNDMKFEEKDKQSVTDAVLEKKTRYYLTENSGAVEGVLKFPLEKVSSIQSEAPLYVATPMGTNRLAAPGGYNFTHGGASLQELIVPVIRSQAKRSNKTEKVGVALMSHNLNMVSSRLKFQIIQSEAVSMTVMERKVICCLYSGEEQVTAEKVVTLDSTDATNLNNRVYEVTLLLNKSVSASMLQLRIYDEEDRLNPLIRETVKNNTVIERDF